MIFIVFMFIWIPSSIQGINTAHGARYGVDEACFYNYNCTLKPHLPCKLAFFRSGPGVQTIKRHHLSWPGQGPALSKEVVYEPSGRFCKPKLRLSWNLPYGKSLTILKGYRLDFYSYYSTTFELRQSVFFNLSDAKFNDYDNNLAYHFDCFVPPPGATLVTLFPFPLAPLEHQQSHNVTVRIRIKPVINGRCDGPRLTTPSDPTYLPETPPEAPRDHISSLTPDKVIAIVCGISLGVFILSVVGAICYKRHKSKPGDETISLPDNEYMPGHADEEYSIPYNLQLEFDSFNEIHAW